MVKTIDASAVSDINFRLDCTTEALRAIWDVIALGGSEAEEFTECLGHVVNALFALSSELTELTGQENSKAPSK